MQFAGIAFLDDCYDAEHQQSVATAIEDLIIVYRLSKPRWRVALCLNCIINYLTPKQAYICKANTIITNYYTTNINCLLTILNT